jgi:hypothetical protein
MTKQLTMGLTVLARAAVAGFTVLGAACDLGSEASTTGDPPIDASAVFACDVPASPPSMGSCITADPLDGGAMVAISCNPVTNAPCTAGETCDATNDAMGNITGFACFNGPNTAGLCALCSVASGPECAGGLSCALATQPWSACARFCCSGADCGDAGACVTSDSFGRSLFGTIAPNVGLCAAM